MADVIIVDGKSYVTRNLKECQQIYKESDKKGKPVSVISALPYGGKANQYFIKPAIIMEVEDVDQ